MRKAILKQKIALVEWSGWGYEDYDLDADSHSFKEGEEVTVIQEVRANKNGKLYIIYSDRINDATVVSDIHLEFIEEA